MPVARHLACNKVVNKDMSFGICHCAVYRTVLIVHNHNKYRRLVGFGFVNNLCAREGTFFFFSNYLFSSSVNMSLCESSNFLA